jgi:hypothetical protein
VQGINRKREHKLEMSPVRVEIESLVTGIEQRLSGLPQAFVGHR